MIGNKTANKIIKVSKTSPQNPSETIDSETERLGERYISSLKRKKVISQQPNNGPEDVPNTFYSKILRTSPIYPIRSARGRHDLTSVL